jgi:hypothetical protein
MTLEDCEVAANEAVAETRVARAVRTRVAGWAIPEPEALAGGTSSMDDWR